MTSRSPAPRPAASWGGVLTLAAALLSAVACTHTSSSASGARPSPAPDMSMSPPTPDPRVGLHAGWLDAGEAIWNLEAVSHTRSSPPFINLSVPGERKLDNSDLAFFDHYVIQGNFSGMQIWDIANPAKPAIAAAYVCPGSQSDVSVYHNLLFVSAEATNGRIDCGVQGVQDTVSQERARGIRIYDISDIRHPRSIKVVQTCRGSHTNTLVTDPHDPANVYIYVSGSAPVRSPEELTGCSGAQPDEDPATALFRLEVIQVPVAHPEDAHIVSTPRIFGELTAPTQHRESAADSEEMAKRFAGSGVSPATIRRMTHTGPTQCHDITAYQAIGLAAGACGGYGLLLDIRDVAHPRRIAAVADSNFSFWHSATFSNDGRKLLFSDEWGGGPSPRCRATDNPKWGADAIYTLADTQLTFQSYYKMPAPQTSYENCTAHNGSLIPIPGRDIMVQGWYQGGLSVLDWTDAAHPKEIAFFDRGPMDSTKLIHAGFWSAYWYNGYIVGSEIARGLDFFQLKPSAFISQNEIDAARLVHFDVLNVQDQPKLVWPPSFAVPRAYLDQLVRDHGISPDESGRVAHALDRAEHLSGQQRSSALLALATQLDGDAPGAGDAARVRAMAAAVRDLAGAQRLATARR